MLELDLVLMNFEERNIIKLFKKKNCLIDTFCSLLYQWCECIMQENQSILLGET